ncbi:carbohydrate ABC transporter permease [Dactylosporangium aurantiacum]|uniref:Carbohydrate ABC transporter permease n=1 Tax=Dactylosporangium aurantiacum TaxID=35754 RepID=A0A9Q9IQM3_9ACTN|nr:carbohydrate ABC transporter permease [Dactylosporangium aurantiacum]MDG6104035.1 carbohydrate ABC transporter permease [Dactylosporangium aurantiacum]UWZ59508.1 carbohydrate ABC transporter permease [Dactylosporangium aurantiacum]
MLVGWAVLTTFPLLWAVLSAFKDDNEILSSAWSLPSKLRWDNWSRAWTEANIGRYFLNTAIVVAGALVLTMLLGAMAAYVLARYTFRGSRAVYFLFVGGMMFPVFLSLVPLFFVVKNLGLLSTHLGLILVYTAYSLPFTVFFLTAFFRTLPTEVAEAAMVDGCSHWGLFFRIMLPMARPGLISVGIFNLLGHWNQYVLPIVLMQGEGAEHKWVLTQGLTALTINQGYAGDYSALFAGMAIAMLPVLILYLVFQRQVQSGLTAGHLK